MISNVVIFNYKVEVSNVMSYHQANKNPLKASFDWMVNLCFLSCHAHGHMYNFYSFTLRLIMQRKTKSMWIQMEQEQALIDFIIQDQTPTFPQTSLRWERPHQIMALLHKEKNKKKTNLRCLWVFPNVKDVKCGLLSVAMVCKIK